MQNSINNIALLAYIETYIGNDCYISLKSPIPQTTHNTQQS